MVSFLIFSGRRIKIFSMILCKCQDEGLLLTNLNKRGTGVGGANTRYKEANILYMIKLY